MNTPRIRYALLGTITIIWLYVILPYIKQIIGLGPIIFPNPQITTSEKHLLITISTILASLSLIFSISEFKKKSENVKTRPMKLKINKKITLPLLVLTISIPFAFGYIYDQNLQTISQMILEIGTTVMDEDFDDTPPGEDPPGWEEDSGDWYTIDDGGNNVYYQNDDGDKEALSISTTGNTSWTDYSFLVDLKFDTGPGNKPDRAALLIFRYTSGNDYYFLALREARDELEVFKHGTGGVGHLRGTASCTLVPDTWYSVNVTIRGDNVWLSIDDTIYFSNLAMGGTHSQGSVGIGTEYYKVMFDNILVELRGD